LNSGSYTWATSPALFLLYLFFPRQASNCSLPISTSQKGWDYRYESPHPTSLIFLNVEAKHIYGLRIVYSWAINVLPLIDHTHTHNTQRERERERHRDVHTHTDAYTNCFSDEKPEAGRREIIYLSSLKPRKESKHLVFSGLKEVASQDWARASTGNLKIRLPSQC
jgi:hypothetical protein